jgi:hypothetical protein
MSALARKRALVATSNELISNRPPLRMDCVSFTLRRHKNIQHTTDIVGMVDLTRSIPDHSLLRWTMTMNVSVDEFVSQYHYSSYESCFKTKYDAKQLPLVR